MLCLLTHEVYCGNRLRLFWRGGETGGTRANEVKFGLDPSIISTTLRHGPGLVIHIALPASIRVASKDLSAKREPFQMKGAERV